MSRTALADQAVGFVLSVDTQSSIDDLKGLQKTFKGFEDAMASVAESVLGDLNKMMDAMDEFAQKADAVKDSYPSANGGVGGSSSSGGRKKSGGGGYSPSSSSGGGGYTMTNSAVAAQLRQVNQVGQRLGYPDMREDPTSSAGAKSPNSANGAPNAESTANSINDLNDTAEKQNEYTKQVLKTLEQIYSTGIGMKVPMGQGSISGIDESALDSSLQDLSKKISDLGGKPDAIAATSGVGQPDVDPLIDAMREFTGRDIRSGGSGSTGSGEEGVTNIIDPNSPVMKALDDLPMKWAKKWSSFFNHLNKGWQKAKDVFNKWLADGTAKALLFFAAATAALGAFIAAADELSEIMRKVRQQTLASNETIRQLSELILEVSSATGEATEEIAKAAIALRQKGFSEVNEDFHQMLETSIKLAEVTGSNRAEMAEFLAETKRGLGLSTANAQKLGVALVHAARKGGIEFDKLKDTVLSLKEVSRRIDFDSEEAQLKGLTTAAAMAQALSKSMGDAAMAAQVIEAASKPFSKEAAEVARLMAQGGDVVTQWELQDLVKSGDFDRIFTSLKKGADAIKEFHGDRAIHYFTEHFGGLANVIDLTKMNLEDLTEAMNDMGKGGNLKSLDEEFKAATNTLSEILDRLKQVFKVILVHAGKPLLAPILFVLRGILTVLNAIPAPLYKVIGLLGMAVAVFAGLKAMPVVLGLVQVAWAKLGAQLAAFTAASTAASTAAVASGTAASTSGALAAAGSGGWKKFTLMLLNPKFLLIAAVLGAVALAIYAIHKATKSTGGLLKAMGESGLKSASDLQESFETLKKSGDSLSKASKALFTGDLKGYLTNLKDFWDGIGEYLDTIPDRILAFVDDLPKIIKGAFDGEAGDGIAEGLFGSMLKALWSLIKIAANPVFWGKLAWGIGKALLITLGEAGKALVLAIAKFIYELLPQPLRNVLEVIPAVGKKLVDITGKAVGGMFSKVNSALSPLLDRLKKGTSVIFDTIRDKVSLVISTIGSAFSKVVQMLLEKYPWLKKLAEFAGTAYENTKEGLNIIKDATVGTAKDIGSKAMNALASPETTAAGSEMLSELSALSNKLSSIATKDGDADKRADELINLMSELVDVNKRMEIEEKKTKRGEGDNTITNHYTLAAKHRGKTNHDNDVLNGA
jgi:hypothetical protein